MNIPQNLRKRINFQGEFEELLSDVSTSYELGRFKSFEVIEMGYEDVNLKLLTTTGSYFVKIFAEERDNAQCLRLINVVKTAIDNGVSHPKFLARENGYIFRERYEGFNIRLAVFAFIEGKTFYELENKISEEDKKKIIQMAATISGIDHRLADLYDSWSLLNFTKEYKKNKRFFEAKEAAIFEKLSDQLEKVKLKDLPHALVHGDLISTNIIKSKNEIYFVDFSVANIYPRIVEMAVLMSDILFDPKDKDSVKKSMKFLLTEYQKYIKLTELEIETLPLFVKLAHAMHIVGSIREKNRNKNITDENEHWLTLGRIGLKQSLSSLS